MTGFRRPSCGPTRRARVGATLVFLAVFAIAQGAASAQLKLPELPLLESEDPLLDDLGLEDLLNVDELLNGELPVSTDLGGTVGGVTGTVNDLIGGNTDDPPATAKKPAPAPLPALGTGTATDAWATNRIPAGLVGPGTSSVSSTKVKTVSYGAAVGDGFARAARRAAGLAAPIAAPMILAFFAVGLLFVAARGPGRLVKVEEERKAFRDQRTFRL